VSLVVRAVAIYFIMLLLMRVSGKRQLAQLTAFDVILLLIISEAVQQALLGNDDFSLTAGIVLVTTLIALDIAMSLVKQWFPPAELVLDGAPVVLLDHGKLMKDRMDAERVDEGDILEAARDKFGLERLDQIRYAILEKTGSISIVPAKNPAG